jgi:hypothetical protein
MNPVSESRSSIDFRLTAESYFPDTPIPFFIPFIPFIPVNKDLFEVCSSLFEVLSSPRNTHEIAASSRQARYSFRLR